MIDSQIILPLVFERNYFNPQCFIQHTSSYLPPNQWDQVCTIFMYSLVVAISLYSYVQITYYNYLYCISMLVDRLFQK